MKALAALLALTLFTRTSLAEQDAAPAEIHALRDRLVDAINKSDFDQMAACLAPNVVITYQNAEVARGRDGVKAFQLKMTAGPDKIIESLHAAVKTDDLTLLPGGTTALATGSSAETYKMTHGPDLTLDARWTATVVRADGQWLVAALHCSTDLFKSPLTAATKKAGVTASTASLLIGLVAGWFLGRKRVL